MNTENKRYDIPDDVLDLTVRSLDKLAVLLEAEAAAFAVVHIVERFNNCNKEKSNVSKNHTI